MSDETSHLSAPSKEPPARRSPAEAMAATWLGLSWLLTILGGCIGFVVAGHLTLDNGVSLSNDEFNVGAGLLGLILGIVFFLPWVGVLSVLRELARSVAAAQPQAAQPVPGEPHATDGHHHEEHHGGGGSDR